MRFRCDLIMVVAGMTLASVATADIVSIPSFNGALSEGFEAFPDYLNGGNTTALTIFGGSGVLLSNGSPNQLWVINPGAGATWGLAGYGRAGTIGDQAMGFYDNAADVDITLTLATPASELGFWYVSGENNSDNDMIVRAFDSNGVQLGSDQSLDSLGNVYIWAGWSSVTGIASLTFTGNPWPVIDELQYNPIPAPASALALLGLAAMHRRRRDQPARPSR